MRWMAFFASLSFLMLWSVGCSCSDDGGANGGDADASNLDGAGTDDGGPRPDGSPIAPPVEGLMGLRIDPPTATVMDDGAAPGEEASFRAIGTFADGERDVTEMVGWVLEHPSLGTLEGGQYTSTGIGGRTRVLAGAGDIEASAELIVVLHLDVVVPDAPANASSMFPDDTSSDVTEGDLAPRFVYPSHETMFPSNLAPVNHQWRADDALDLFELRYESEVSRIRLYTTERNLLPSLEAWATITQTHAGGSATVSVRGIDTEAPETVYGTQSVELFYSRSAVLGALYYWSTGAQGVMRGHVSAALATKFYTDPDSDDNTCVACHTVSRDGRRLAVGYGGEKLREVTIPDREVLIPPDESTDAMEYGWGTFNPGATRLLYASKGALRLLDADTGATLMDVGLPEDAGATHPDWSPDGRFVALAYTAPGGRLPGNKDVQGSSLARLPVEDDGSFGDPDILLEATGENDSIYFPSYSPDSRWIAFVRGTGKSKDNETSALYLMAADGTGEPILITRLNERVNDGDGITEIGNTMPTWAPSTTAEIFWLAFSSIRAYGDILSSGERDQLWGAAIDPARISTAEDASHAAFWFPFQDVEEGNHRAFWALATEDACPSTVELCDELDNDCDGIVDEMCCTPSPEECGDGVDNDCDGEEDEGCGCLSTEENCMNSIDDDCDTLVDGEDEDCILI